MRAPSPRTRRPRPTTARPRLRWRAELEDGAFTDEDRRKAAAVTNQIRRERAEILALELENQALERRLAVVEARRRRKREYARARRARLREEQEEFREEDKIALWLERGYGARVSRTE
jgi:hypothetical protein